MLAVAVRVNWEVWEAKLGPFTSETTARQLLHRVYGYMVSKQDQQGREEIDAMLENREPLDLETGRPEGYKSEDPAERTRARIAMMEEKKREREANG